MIGNIIAGIYSVGTVPVVTSYESIATVSVGSGGASNIEFTSITSGWKHLQIRGISQTPSVRELQIQFNNDTNNNYAYHLLYGTGSSAGAAAINTNSKIATLTQAGQATASNTFSAVIIDILDYGSTSKNKTLRILSGTEQNNTTGEIGLSSGLWQSTSAITSIKLFPSTTGTFNQYTTFALYGIKD